MSVPGIVQSALDGEEIAARVSLGGDDELFITPTRSIIYRADGLLSDESADEFPHDADRLTIAEGRRKTKFSLEYALDGTRTFAVPASKTDAVLHPVLAGVLNGNGITDAGETVTQTYRFSELTLIITSDRLVKHIGEPVWDEDYEEYHFDDVTNLAFEDGSVATSIVLTVNGRPQRIKAPNEDANDCRERLERALFAYHDVESLAELNAVLGEDEPVSAETESTVDFGGDGLDPLDANPPATEPNATPNEGATTVGESASMESVSSSQSASSDPLAGGATGSDSTTADRDRAGSADGHETATAETGDLFEEATSAAGSATGSETTANGVEHQYDHDHDHHPNPELLDRLDALEAAVERQNDHIESQQETIETLIAELRQGR